LRKTKINKNEFLKHILALSEKKRYRDHISQLRSIEELKQSFIEHRNNVIFIDVLKTSFPIYYEILEPLIILK
jgi:hypothetical protein